MRRIRVLIADDHCIVRQGLRSLLEDQPGIEVAGEAGDGREAVELAERLAPDVVVMDIGMPLLNGVDATRGIAAKGLPVRVVALSMYADKRFIADMFRAGAAGYLLKDCAFEEIVGAVRAVAAGKVYISPQVAGAMVEEFVVRTAGEVPEKPLSLREREVLQLIAEGQTTKQIAVRLGLSVKTVETHRSAVMNKLQIFSVPELTKYAIREGITSVY